MKPLLIDQPTLANCFEQNLDSIEVFSTGSFNGFYKPIWGPCETILTYKTTLVQHLTTGEQEDMPRHNRCILLTQYSKSMLYSH